MSDSVDKERPYVSVDTSTGTSSLEDGVIGALESAGFVVEYDAGEDAFVVQYRDS